MRRIGDSIAKWAGALFCAVVCTCVAAPSAFAETLQELDENYRLAAASYATVIDKQDENKREIAEKEAQVEQAHDEAVEAERLSGEAAVALYKSENNRSDLLDFVLESDSLTDALARYDSYERVQQHYAQAMEQSRDKKAELEAQVSKLEERKAQIADELVDARLEMERADAAKRDADHSDGYLYHQKQNNGSNCGATSFIVGVNILLHENRFVDNVAEWAGPGFNGDSTINLVGKGMAWLSYQGLSDQIGVNAVLGDITTTQQLYDELNQGHVVVISSGGGSVWQHADGTVAPPGSFPDGHWFVVYYYEDGVFYANDSSVSASKGAGCAYTEEQMQQWLNGRATHFATVLRKL